MFPLAQLIPVAKVSTLFELYEVVNKRKKQLSFSRPHLLRLPDLLCLQRESQKNHQKLN